MLRTVTINTHNNNNKQCFRSPALPLHSAYSHDNVILIGLEISSQNRDYRRFVYKFSV